MSAFGGADFAALRSEVAPEVPSPGQVDFDEIAFGQWAPGEWEAFLDEMLTTAPPEELFDA